MSNALDWQSVPEQTQTLQLFSMTVNVVCVCFVAYDNDQSGKDWGACASGRWLHEDCTDDCMVDSDGNERLCFTCLNRVFICFLYIVMDS